MAIDDDGPVAALCRSWRTTRGAFWRILGNQLVANLLVGVVGGTVTSIFEGNLVPRNMPDPDTVSPLFAQFASLAPFFLFGTLAGLLVALLSGPFLVLFTTVLYIDQRRRLGLEPASTGPQQW